MRLPPNQVTCRPPSKKSLTTLQFGAFRLTHRNMAWLPHSWTPEYLLKEILLPLVYLLLLLSLLSTVVTATATRADSSMTKALPVRSMERPNSPDAPRTSLFTSRCIVRAEFLANDEDDEVEDDDVSTGTSGDTSAAAPASGGGTYSVKVAESARRWTAAGAAVLRWRSEGSS